MRDSARTWVWSAGVTALLVVASVGLLASSAVARPQSVSVEARFGPLFPGASQAKARTITLTADALVSSTTTLVGGDRSSFAWKVELCAADDLCRPVDRSLEGARLSAGRYTLAIRVDLLKSAVRAAKGSVEGTVSFIGADDGGQVVIPGEEPDAPPGDNPGVVPGDGGLASTGVFVWGIAGLALALLGLGYGLVLFSQRRNRDEEDEGTR